MIAPMDPMKSIAKTFVGPIKSAANQMADVCQSVYPESFIHIDATICVLELITASYYLDLIDVMIGAIALTAAMSGIAPANTVKTMNFDATIIGAFLRIWSAVISLCIATIETFYLD